MTSGAEDDTPQATGLGGGRDRELDTTAGLVRAVSLGYLLRAAWTTIVVGALIHTATAGPIPDPLASPWLQAAIALAVLDLAVYLTLLVAHRVRPAWGTGWLETPLVTAMLAVGTLVPGSLSATSPLASILVAAVLVALTGYTLVGHLLILRWHRRQPPAAPAPPH